MFGDATLVNALFLLAMWLLIGAAVYGRLTLSAWVSVVIPPPADAIPADVRAAGEGWVAAQNRRAGVEDNTLGALLGPSLLESPPVLEWAAQNSDMHVPTDAWFTILLWPLFLLRGLAMLVAKGVNRVLLPVVRERAAKVMCENLVRREELAEASAQSKLRRHDFDAINKLLNRDRGEDDDFGPAAQLL